MEPQFEQAEQNVYVRADRKKHARIIQNLISNAVKYSDKRLEFLIDQESEGCIRLQIITDPGDKIDASRIFDRFVKAEQDEKRFAIMLTLPAHEA